MAHNHVYGICESKCKEDVYPKKRVDEMLNGNVTLDIIENTLVEAFSFNDGSEIAHYSGNPLVFDRNEAYDSDDQSALYKGTASRIYRTPRQFKKGDVVKVHVGASDTGDMVEAYICWLDELPETIDLNDDCIYEDSYAIGEDITGIDIELTLTKDAFGYLLIKITKDESELNEGVISVSSIKYFTATNAKAQLKHYDTNLELEVEASGSVGQTTEGKTYTIDGYTYNGSSSSEIFNDYANNKAAGGYSHAEGGSTSAVGSYSHAEGYATIAKDSYAHAEGYQTKASGYASHAEGYGTTASDNGAHAEGDSTVASGSDAHAEGYKTVAQGDYSHAEGRQTNALGERSHAEGYGSNALPSGIGYSTNSTDVISAWNSKKFSLAQGETTHVEGRDCLALDIQAHAEGYQCKAIAGSTHAEGYLTEASDTAAHSEGRGTKASGYASHAEGYDTVASGESAHSEGKNTVASGIRSHAEGDGTIAASSCQHVQGKYNVEDASTKFAFIIGNGSSSARSNAFAIDWDGNIYIGNAETGVNVSTLAETLASLTTRIEALESGT